MNNNIIKYNDQALDFPTPVVEIKSENVYLNKSLGVEEQITLKGQITGDFQGLQTAQAKLIDIFSKNFKQFKILEFGTSSYESIYEKNNIQVLNISFADSNYNKILDYTVNLKSCDLKGSVISPKNDFDFQLNKDFTINLGHAVSAVGISNNSYKSNALDNAINYVKNLTGLNNIPAYQNINFNLFSVKESINRLQSSYSIEESYIGDSSSKSISGGINRYSIDISSGVKDIALKINLQGQFSIGKNENFDIIKNSINPAQIVSGSYSGYFNPIPISYNIQSDKNEKTISYNFNFDNINLPNPYIKYNISEQYDNIYKITNKNISAEVLARGHQLERLSNSENLLNQINLKAIAGETFKIISSEKVINKDKNTFVVSASFTDKNIPGGYADGKYTVTEDISIPIIKPNLSLGGYILQSFGVKTFAKTKVQGEFKGSPGAKPGAGNASSDSLISDTESYDPVNKTFSYTYEYYGGSIATVPI